MEVLVAAALVAPATPYCPLAKERTALVRASATSAEVVVVASASVASPASRLPHIGVVVLCSVLIKLLAQTLVLSGKSHVSLLFLKKTITRTQQPLSLISNQISVGVYLTGGKRVVQRSL
jgi:hypothetical protein